MKDEQTLDYYNRQAATYGSVAPSGNFVVYRDRFGQKLPRGAKVLDLGCGGGHAALAFLSQGFAVTALDGSPALAQVAAERTGLDVVVSDFADIDYQAEFQGIWAAASLTHVPYEHLADILVRIRQALQPTGLLVASFKRADQPWRDQHGRLFSALSAESLHQVVEQAGLRVEAIDTVPGKSQETEWIWLFARQVNPG
ncbi:MAG: class I SAM-dependent methyltransferase [Pseudomonadota bacterium]